MRDAGLPDQPDEVSLPGDEVSLPGDEVSLPSDEVSLSAPHEGDLRHELGRMLLLQHRETCAARETSSEQSPGRETSTLPRKETPSSLASSVKRSRL